MSATYWRSVAAPNPASTGRLRNAGYPAEIQPTREGVYHVRIRQLASREDAEALAESLRGKHGVAEPLVTQ